MYSNMKQGKCYKCEGKLQIPLAECYAQCQQCGKINLFLCHVIKKQANLNKLKIQCTQCKQMYTIIICPKCKGYCGIKNFMSGFAYECSCKNKMTYLICNKCTNILALPASKNFERTKLKCKSCNNEFRYKICSTCRSCIYKKGEDQTQIYLCGNQKCPQSGSGQQNSLNPYGIQTEQVKNQINNRISQFQEQANNQNISFKDICKVCIDKQAVMINTICYHLALCQSCAYIIQDKKQGECPICRTKGKYQKVYKP